MKILMLKLSAIVLRDQCQMREALDTDHVNGLADILRGGGQFDDNPVVFHDGREYILADGWHRVSAAQVAKVKTLPCDVREGTLRDAILYSAGANAHGNLRRSHETKRRAVDTLLEDEEWAKWSDREIAKHAGVDHKTVAIRRHLLKEHLGKSPHERKCERNGSTYTTRTRDLPPEQQLERLEGRERRVALERGIDLFSQARIAVAPLGDDGEEAAECAEKALESLKALAG